MTMARHEITGHIDLEQLVQLVMDELPVDKEDEVLLHLHNCNECAELSRYMHEVSEAVEGIASAGLMVRIAAAVRSVLGWGPRMSGAGHALAELAFGGIVAEPAGTASLALANLPPLAGGLPAVLEQEAPGERPIKTRSRAANRRSSEGSVPVRTRGKIRAPAAGSAGVEFDDSPKVLKVRLTTWPTGVEPPALAVVPRRGDPFRAVWEPDGDQLQATVTKPSGGFALVFCGPIHSGLR
jgi:hypothetical protein